MNPEDRVDRLMQYCVKSHDQESKPTLENEGLWNYAKVTQVHSVHECPEAWKHPLDLVLQVAQSQRTVKFESTNENGADTVHEYNGLLATDQNKSGDTINNTGFSLPTSSKSDVSQNCVFSTLPKPLSLNCSAAHLHKWCNDTLWDSEDKMADSSLENGRIQVIYSRGVTFRYNIDCAYQTKISG